MRATVDNLQKENTRLRSRDIEFESLLTYLDKKQIDTKNLKKNAGDLKLYETLQETQKRLNFITQQLHDADETLLQGKKCERATNEVLEDEIKSLEGQIDSMNKLYEELKLTHGSVDWDKYQEMYKKNAKNEKAKQRMSDLLNNLEIELTKKKVEHQTALNSIVQLQQDNKALKDEVVRVGLALKTIADDNFELKEYMRLATKGKKM